MFCCAILVSPPVDILTRKCACVCVCLSASVFLLSLFPSSQVVTERKVLEVHITKGMRNGQKITFHGEADEAPGVVPGDIIFIVEEKVKYST